jgi:formylglycine-generating enzyme required for sulfatase activity
MLAPLTITLEREQQMPQSKRKSVIPLTLAAATLFSVLAGCATVPVPQISSDEVVPVSGPAVSTNRTPLELSYVCFANKMIDYQAPQFAVAVGSIPDYTGKLSQFEGSSVTQGGSLMVFSALAKLGNVVTVHERFDTRVTELELAYLDKRRLGDGSNHEVDGQVVPWAPYYGGTIEKSDVFIVGGITELNYNIRSGGAEARIGQTGPKARTFTLNVAVDLRLVDSKSLRVWEATSVQKQIVGQEIGFEVFRFFGGDELVDINVGAKAQEPIQFAVRSALEAAILQLLGAYTGIPEDECLPEVWRVPQEHEVSSARTQLERNLATNTQVAQETKTEEKFDLRGKLEAEEDAELSGSPNKSGQDVKREDELTDLDEAANVPAEDCVRCPEMLFIEGGDFVMGSSANEVGRASDEGPAATVEIRPFWIGRYEVTNFEWGACVEAGRCVSAQPVGRPVDMTKPVAWVSWKDAQDYTAWLSEVTGFDYRLPSEAEWEYAARGGTQTAYWWGTDFDADKVASSPVRVSDTSTNPYGLAGAVDNLREWVSDCYINSLHQQNRDGTPVDRADCKLRVIRGGAYSSDKGIYRSANRARRSPSSRTSQVGFRVVRTNAANESVSTSGVKNGQ